MLLWTYGNKLLTNTSNSSYITINCSNKLVTSICHTHRTDQLCPHVFYHHVFCTLMPHLVCISPGLYLFLVAELNFLLHVCALWLGSHLIIWMKYMDYLIVCRKPKRFLILGWVWMNFCDNQRWKVMKYNLFILSWWSSKEEKKEKAKLKKGIIVFTWFV